MAVLVTHWSFHDAPEKAICGAYITRREFSREPSCPECQRQLAQLQAEAG